MPNKIDGGAILPGSVINTLLNLKTGEVPNEKSVVGLAVRAVGQDNIFEHSAKVKVYAIFQNDIDEYFFLEDAGSKYLSIEGRGLTDGDTPDEVEKYRFFYFHKMDVYHFCFSFFGTNYLRELIGNGPNFPDLYIKSDLVQDEDKPNEPLAFTLSLRLNSNSEIGFVDTAPCPPHWDNGVPHESFISKKLATMDVTKKQIKQLKDLAKLICNDDRN